MSMKTLNARLDFLGKNDNDRLKKQKLRSFYSALKNDYNSRVIQLPDGRFVQGLMNDNNQKTDYDYKWLSIDYDSLLEPGDVYQLVDDQTHWMIYLQDILETAYLRTQVVKCLYTLEIDDEKYWIYFQGPTETDLRWFIKGGINFNELNLSGTLFIKNTPKTKEFFKRFTKIELEGHKWEVQVTDSITVPGIIELEIQEYYDDSVADLPKVIKEKPAPVINEDMTVEPPKKPSLLDMVNNPLKEDKWRGIRGQEIVKQDEIVGYEISPRDYSSNKHWKVIGNPRVAINDISEDGRICGVRIYKGAIRNFTVSFGEHSKNVQIDIRDSYIHGEDIVYPYEHYNYYIKHGKCKFYIDDPSKAKIITQNDKSCKVEIITGKSGKFNLICVVEEDCPFCSKLPITIKSI